METARLILDPPAEGAWNMSVDQALLETADATGLITLRFYSWSEPTLSLGYFQSHLDRELHRPSIGCKLVRRRTGGGAILHDNELTYSLCVPSQNRWSAKNSELYRLVHGCIIDLLQSEGITSSLYGDMVQNDDPNAAQNSQPAPTVDQRSFMCFNRRSDGDIVIKGRKVVGSAQRRAKKALLQHGSILLGSSQFAPDLEGINDLQSAQLSPARLSQMLARRLFKCLRIEPYSGVMQTDENEAAKNSHSSQFDSDAWNRQR